MGLSVAKNMLMARPKKTDDSADRHKPNKQLRIPAGLAALLEAAAEAHFTNPTQEAIRAIREYLDRLGLLQQPRREKDD